MPWELTIVNAEDRRKPLGGREDVIARVAAALPGAVLREAPGPGPEIIAKMPPILREHFMQPRQLNAEFDGDDFSILFYAANQPQIESLGAEVRGDGNPIAALAALCRPNGWAAINAADGAIVDLAAEDSPEWRKFLAWRDGALDSLKSNHGER